MLGFLLLLAGPVPAGPSAREIMERVAENQERSQQMRAAFCYRQNVTIRMFYGNGGFAREEINDFSVRPTDTGTKKERVRFLGRYQDKGKIFEYSRPHYERKEMDIDGDLISDLAEDFTSDEKSRDQIGRGYFPLTREEQKKYSFRLEGRQDYQGRDVFRVTFSPRGEDGAWAGEILVDAHEFQPALITTRLARGIPLIVRTLLGTNLKYLGFKLAYARFEDGLWFPVRYGGEFDVRAVFFYRRRISISLLNEGFERADVKSRIQYQ